MIYVQSLSPAKTKHLIRVHPTIIRPWKIIVASISTIAALFLSNRNVAKFHTQYQKGL